ncbi:hypothetical protein MKW94_027562 [Papaver nudicaule]|uniref:Mitochondrial carrier protein n=1 Tax=Papaver nudicaule TaxID=74823 RepID=A0AA41VQS1_PAPNU|nr:hypothetical protein [Papaver nudicaule]
MESEISVVLNAIKKPVGPERSKRKVSVLKLFSWGVSVTAVAPLRRLEILLQVQDSRNIKYKDIIQGLHHMRRTDGFRGLFKGNGAYIAHAMSFSSANVLVSYPLARILLSHWQQLGKENAKPPVWLLGFPACSFMIATAAAYPMDMVQGRLSVQTGTSPYQYRGIYHALSTIVREEGTRALYKGCLPYTIGQVLYVGLNFTVYESLLISLTSVVIRRFLEATPISERTELRSKGLKPEVIEEMRSTIRKKLPYFHVFALAVSHTFAYPFSVINRRMQMGGWKKYSSIIACDGNNTVAIEFTGMRDAFMKTIRNDGFKALYKGSVANLVKVFPASVVAFVTHWGLTEGLGLEVNINHKVRDT